MSANDYANQLDQVRVLLGIAAASPSLPDARRNVAKAAEIERTLNHRRESPMCDLAREGLEARWLRRGVAVGVLPDLREAARVAGEAVIMFDGGFPYDRLAYKLLCGRQEGLNDALRLVEQAAGEVTP